MRNRASIVRHLVEDYCEPIKDPVWRNIPLSRALLRITTTPAFQKLNGIKQLGPTYLVYPGATHTRLNHSLGVYHLARRMLLELCIRGAHVSEKMDLEGARAFLCAALLHDLGHYPYAHSLKDLEVRSHESLTAERVLLPDISALIREQVGTDPELVAAIVDPARGCADGDQLHFFRNILSGVLDPDKLDYLNRDAYFCGVPHGVQDVDFVLAEIRPHSSGLAVTEKGLSAVESILFSKYLMYKTVYWHKTVRIATAMIKKAVLLALAAGVLSAQDLYWLDDMEFYLLAEKHSFRPLDLIRRVWQRRLHKLVATVPFREDNDHHRYLQPLANRLSFEEELARRLGKRLGREVAPESILIDIPEPINFDIVVAVLNREENEEVPYHRSRSVFNRTTVSDFASSLRSMALVAEEEADLLQALAELGGKSILERGLS